MTYKNTYNKFLWLAQQAKQYRAELTFKASTLFFDEMESIIHTKCKPVSLGLMVNESYEILDIQVAEMPAKGRLARFSLEKYGKRPDQREFMMKNLFEQVAAKLVNIPEKVLSDAKPSYRKLVKAFFPHSFYEVHSRSEKERHQNRLHEKIQRKRFDPMFPLNQRCAKLRAQIKRLARRSWCTSKKIENLQGHLDIYLANQ